MAKELKAHRLNKEIRKLQAELIRHQRKCNHKKKTIKSCGNTGNYDPSQDKYWKENSCPTCLKKWDSNLSYAN